MGLDTSLYTSAPESQDWCIQIWNGSDKWKNYIDWLARIGTYSVSSKKSMQIRSEFL